MVNGTCALQVALQVAGVQRNDEVLVPTLSFVATANAVHYCGAIPHFVDSDEETLGMDPEALEEWLQQVAEPTQEFSGIVRPDVASGFGPDEHFRTSL